MPINIQHAIMFTFVFIMIVSLLSSTTYIIISNMIADTYRYEKSIEKANEKLRLIAIVTSDGLYYGIRNIATMSITIRELGIVDIHGRKHVLLDGLELKPGETYIGKLEAYYKGTIYAITARGNIFSTSIINLIESREVSFTLRGLTPACIQALSPISYIIKEYKYTVGICTYAYVFGYIIVDDPYSDDSIYIVFGPYNIADLYKTHRIPFSTRDRVIKGNIRVEALFKFVIEKYRNRIPYYKILMPLDIERRDWKRGLIVHGCIGILWRTISNVLAGIRVEDKPWSICRFSESTGRICEYIGSIVIPSALDVKTLVTHLARNQLIQLPVEAPSGSQVYIIFSRCFTLELKTIKSIRTTETRPWTYLGIAMLYTYLVFPGINRSNLGDLNINGIDISVKLDPEILISNMLNQI